MNFRPLVAWYEKDKGDRSLSAWLAGLTGYGHVAWRKALSGQGGDARNPVMRVDDNEIAVAWIETAREPDAPPAVWSVRFDRGGNQIGQPIRAGEASRTTWNLNAALSGGVFYVVYDAALGARANELQMLAIGREDVRSVRLTSDDGHASVYPDLGVSTSGQAALAWFDERDGNTEIYLSVQPLGDLVEGRTGSAQRITHTEADSIGAYLAWNQRRLALVWCDAEEGQKELYAQEFGEDGQSVGPSKRLTHTAAESSIPSVRAWQTGFVVGWNEYVLSGDAAHLAVATSRAMSLRLP